MNSYDFFIYEFICFMNSYMNSGVSRFQMQPGPAAGQQLKQGSSLDTINDRLGRLSMTAWANGPSSKRGVHISSLRINIILAYLAYTCKFFLHIFAYFEIGGIVMGRCIFQKIYCIFCAYLCIFLVGYFCIFFSLHISAY